MATFGELKTEVLTNLIDTPDAVQTYVGSYVNRAIRKLQTKHNFKAMETSATYTSVEGVRYIGYRSSRWKQARKSPFLTDNYGRTRQLYWSDEIEAKARYGTSTTYDYGAPRLIVENEVGHGIEGDDGIFSTFDLYPYSDGLSDYDDGEYRITIPYWNYLTVLGSDDETNWFSENAEQWIVYQATADGFYTNEDEGRAQMWEKRAGREYGDVLMADKDRTLATVETMVPHIGAMRPHTQE